MALKALGVNDDEGTSIHLAPLAAPGPRKTAFIRLLLGVERWLRTGRGPEGLTLSPPNAVAHPKDADRHAAYVDVLTKIMLPKLLQASFSAAPGGQDVVGTAAKVLDTMASSASRRFEHAVSSRRRAASCTARCST